MVEVTATERSEPYTWMAVYKAVRQVGTTFEVRMPQKARV